MLKNKRYTNLVLAGICLTYAACKVPELAQKTENKTTPASFRTSQDTTNAATMKWRDYFTDPNLVSLIDTALKNNQELNITFQEIQIAATEIRARQGELLPFVTGNGAVAAEKVARYTDAGAGEASTEIKPGTETPEILPDFLAALYAHWEIDIWHKLRNAKKAAVERYLATVEGRNFVITNLVAEVANSYYELLALDNQLEIVRQNITLQTNALEIVKVQKEAARTTELAVRKFEAEVLKTRSLQFDILQKITEAENRINFLLARYPQHINRDAQSFTNLVPAGIRAGIPSQLLANRPDIRQAELELSAAKLDIQVARAQFYPSLGITAALGYQAFNPAYLLRTPTSMLYSLGADLVGPLINKSAIKAAYYTASAKQIQAVFNYERTILNGYIEVANQVSNITNLDSSYNLKARQVQALTQSIDISNDLFKFARADYLEVLLTQRDALEARLELIETKRDQLNAVVNIYQALGGGWN